MLALSLMIGALTLGQWGAGGCGPVGPLAQPVVTPAPTGYEWRHTDGSPWRQLFRDGTPIGIWNEQTDRYQPYNPATGSWGAEQRPPWQPASKSCGCTPSCKCGDNCHCTADKRCDPACSCDHPGAIQNFGIIREKLAAAGEHYRLNGEVISGDHARQALTGGQLPDDAGKLRLTIIGPDADRQRVLDDLAKTPALADVRDRFVVQAYPPEHWAVTDSGFVTNGHPTIYVQAADGTVLHRQNDYAGPEDLAGALRKADPNYDAHRDPDLRRGRLGRFSLPHVPPVLWLLAGGFLLFLLFRKGK